MMKCPKTSDGKHVWRVFRITSPVFGKGAQHRKCEKCGYEEVNDVSTLTGRSKGWKPVQ